MNAETDTAYRSDARHPVFKEGKLFADNSEEMDVVIRDMSAGGARLSVPESAELPRILNLLIAGNTDPTPVRVCWRSADQVGVQFLSLERAKELQLDAAGSQYEDARGTHALERSPAYNRQSSISQPDTAEFLAAEYDMRFVPVASEPGHGVCIANVRLRNLSEFSAIHPFVCVPALGFDIQSAADWAAREIASVRKMIRFGCTTDLILHKSETADCCQIVLPFDPRDGGYVGYAEGIEHPLAQLPDIRLSCQVGAANFPAERLGLIIPASHIAGLIIDHVALDSDSSRAAA